MAARWCFLGLLLMLVQPLWPQAGQNPFDLEPRGEVPVVEEEIPPADSTAPANPFDLQGGEAVAAPVVPPVATPPADTPPTDAMPEGVPQGGLLALTLILLVLTVVSLLFFRSLYVKAYRAVINDNMLSQLYREREAGAFGRFLIGYGLFFFAGGFFVFLVGKEWGYFSTDRMLRQVGLYSLGL
ncbi:MAG: hypothetical protein KDC54_17445, partial [Lewinella sp.]|nr:hypothetical protein [Lewinella sp.]